MSERVFDLTAQDWGSLAIAWIIIAGGLVLEHKFVGDRGWSRRNYYALGLVTVLGGLLIWAILCQITITPAIALVVLVAACTAGGPDYLLLWYEDRRQAEAEAERRQAWQSLADQHHEVAAELALQRIVGASHRYSRAHDLLESIVFLRGGIHRDLADMQLLVDQLEPLLATILGPAAGDGTGD